MNADKVMFTSRSVSSVYSDEKDSDDDVSVNDSMDPKLRLALTIKNWSMIPENDFNLLNEGAIHALVALSTNDNDTIKKYVAKALYHLSSREPNRLPLIKAGAVNGLVTISMRPSGFTTAKLCALALCNLTMADDEEAVVADSGAILALTILLGLRGHRLLPICVQALYNLTCSHYTTQVKPEIMRRIVKSLVNIPSSNHDNSIHIMKAIYNICRYPYVRGRIIDDGFLHIIISFTESIPNKDINKENKENLTSILISCYHMLAEIPSGRIEMLQKSCIQHLYNLIPYCTKESVLELLRLMYLLIPTKMSTPYFEASAWMIIHISQQWNTIISILEYCSVCFYLFSQQQNRLTFLCIKKMIICIIQLFEYHTPLIQASVMATCEMLFFNEYIKQPDDIQEMIIKFCEYSTKITDTLAIKYLAICTAKLSQESLHMTILKDNNLLQPLLTLLTIILDKDEDIIDLSIKECICIAICHIAITLKKLPKNITTSMSKILIELLDQHQPSILYNTICSIRALGCIGLCHNELISKENFSRVARIIEEHPTDTSLVRNSLAVLTVYSYEADAHIYLAVEDVIRVLYVGANSNDMNSKELIATTLCNMSVTEVTKSILIEKGLVEALSLLSGTTNELIQELCAKAICNITYSITLHSSLVNHGILPLISVISLVRTISYNTKQLCARSLLNLLTDDNLTAFQDESALRIFCSLSTIEFNTLQHICARGLLMCTMTESRRIMIKEQLTVLYALFHMTNSSSIDVQCMSGIAICNLLYCPILQPIVISHDGLSLLRILAFIYNEELKISIGLIIMHLLSIPELHPLIMKESLVSILLLFLQDSSKKVFEIGLYTLSYMSTISALRSHIIEEEGVSILVNTVLTNSDLSIKYATVICQILCYLSFEWDKADHMVTHSHILVLFHTLYHKQVCTSKAASMIAIILRNLSYDAQVRKHLIQTNSIKLLGVLFVDIYHHATKDINRIRPCLLPFLYEVSTCDIVMREEIMNQSIIDLIRIVIEVQMHNESKSDTIIPDQSTSSTIDNNIGINSKEKTLNIQTNLDEQIDVDNDIDSDTYSDAYSDDMHFHDDNISQVSDKNTKSGTKNTNKNKQSSPKKQKQKQTNSILRKTSMYTAETLSTEDILFIAAIIHSLAQSDACHAKIIHTGCLDILIYLSKHGNTGEYARYEIASAICLMSMTKNITLKKKLADYKASVVLTSIAQVTTRKDTQMQCSLGMSYLSDTTKVNAGVVNSLLKLTLLQDDTLDSPTAIDHKTFANTTSNIHGVLTPGSSSMTPSNHNTHKQFFGNNMIGKDLNHSQSSFIGDFTTSMSPTVATTATATNASSTPMSKAAKKNYKYMIEEGLRQSSSNLKLTFQTINNQVNDEPIDIYIQRLKDDSLKIQDIFIIKIDYSIYTYYVINVSTQPETIGYAEKCSFPNLSLPNTSSTTLSIDITSRFHELYEVITKKDPLPKIMTTVSENMELSEQKLEEDSDESSSSSSSSSSSHNSYDGVGSDNRGGGKDRDRDRDRDGINKKDSTDIHEMSHLSSSSHASDSSDRSHENQNISRRLSSTNKRDLFKTLGKGTSFKQSTRFNIPNSRDSGTNNTNNSTPLNNNGTPIGVLKRRNSILSSYSADTDHSETKSRTSITMNNSTYSDYSRRESQLSTNTDISEKEG